jgi:oligopeptide transport system ATP-binding protein
MAKLLQVTDLVKHFPIKTGLFSRTTGLVRAVDGVTFDVERGETLGLVGESGCGKSTTGRTIMRLLNATSGSVMFEERDVLNLSGNLLKRFRRDVQIIFQDPYASLNPRMTIGEIVAEPLLIHDIGTAEERRSKVRDLLDTVGLNPEHGNRYPRGSASRARSRWTRSSSSATSR